MKPLSCFEEFIFQPDKITVDAGQLRGVPINDDTVFNGEDEDGYAPAGDAEALPAGEYEVTECDATHVWLEGNGKRYWVQKHSLDMLRQELGIN